MEKNDTKNTAIKKILTLPEKTICVVADLSIHVGKYTYFLELLYS